MTKSIANTPITRSVLKKELSSLEKRLDSKIDRLDVKIDQVEKRLDAKIDSKVDIAVESMKDYVDGKFSQVQLKFGQVQVRFDQVESSIHQLGDKLDTSVKGIVDLIERGMGNQAKMQDQIEDHEKRIFALETK